MTFGSKRLDNAYDQWATQTPDDYFKNDEELDIEGDLAEEKDLKKEHKGIKLHPKQRCQSCHMLYWKKHKCQRKKNEKK